MASERNKMNSTAQQYINKVKSAKNDCVTANTYISTAQAAISQNWQSDAGKALADALTDVSSRLDRVINNLITAREMMIAEAKSIYDNWPEGE